MIVLMRKTAAVNIEKTSVKPMHMFRPPKMHASDGRVTFAAVANVLHSLGLVDDLAQVARRDPFGHKLEDAKLEARQRVRAPKMRRVSARVNAAKYKSGAFGRSPFSAKTRQCF
jgi:hypothetical protein